MPDLRSHIIATTRDESSRERLASGWQSGSHAGNRTRLGKSTHGKKRTVRINSIASRLTIRSERKREASGLKRLVLSRKKAVQNPRVKTMIAYDLETTSIKAGTPQPLYLTAYGAEFSFSGAIKDIYHLRDLLIHRFLTVEHNGARFVAWNGNKFDVYFIAAALLHSPRYILRPYLTKSKQLRGLRVIDRELPDTSFEFLDGMSMTGVQKPLDAFLETFAPDYHKLQAPDWEKTQFNPDNKKHVAYAERDSEGLYHALKKAESILLENFSVPLQGTIGKAGIRIFQEHLPSDVQVWELPYSLREVVRHHIMRGGYCFCARQFAGAVWKYDINQAYAAAMRDARLPAGRCYRIKGKSRFAKCAVYHVAAALARNSVPMYITDQETGAKAFPVDRFEAWITSIELEQLESEGWMIQIKDGWAWEDSFTMKEYVDKLERLRIHCEGGPKSAQGEMIKAVGNNSYGKTVETLEGIELVLSHERPEGFYEYQCPDEEIQHIWFRLGEPQRKPYHQPQIGAFITAHVRMVLRRAILKAPDDWIYADTDCVIFSRPVSLDFDRGRYGAWKVESENKPYRIITKKVYADFGATEKRSKGLNVNRLTDHDFIEWFEGRPPTQRQTQRNNFLKAMTGREMFRDHVKIGQKMLDKSSLTV